MTKTDEPKTDDEINEMFRNEMLPEWIKALMRLWTAFGKSPTSEMTQVYTEQLGDIPLGLLEIAIKRTIRDHRFSSVPTVHDVWVALARELGNPADIDQAIDAWEQQSFRRCVVHFEPAFAVRTCVAVETVVPS